MANKKPKANEGELAAEQIKESRLGEIKIVDTDPTVESVAAKVFPVLLESYLRLGGRCQPNGYSDVTEDAVIVITNQSIVIAEGHIKAMAMWRKRKAEAEEGTATPNPDEGQTRFA